MQPAPSGGYRSLEINNTPGALVYQGKAGHWIANAPSGISIVGAYTPAYAVLVDCALGGSDGFSAQYFWGGGAQTINYLTGWPCNNQGYGYGTGINQSFAPSSYFGWGVTCSYKATCSTLSSAGAVLGVNGIQLTAQENSGPGLIADGSNNLWYQASGWVRGDGWPVGFSAFDASGVCSTDLWVNGLGTGIDSFDDSSPDTSSFTQCPEPAVVEGTLDTTAYANGPLTISLAARNAAGVLSSPSQTLELDNTPVTLSLSTLNDPDPNVWVDHSVRVLAAASAGPSGVDGTSCSTDSGASYAYPSGGVTLNGTGVWTVACSSWNNAYDVSGQPATASQTVNVHIDETPPSVAFEPVDPADPQAVVADTSDAQSRVAGGQIQMRPAGGGSWQSLATQFDGSHLLARFDDATLAPGKWVIEATSCDNAGNCASTDQTLTLPVRIASVSSAGFQQADDPVRARVVRERVRVGWHWVTVRRHGTLRRVRRGGRYEIVRLVKYAESCSERRVKIGRHRWRERRVCHRPQFALKHHEQVPFGKPAMLYGVLTTVQGVPIGGAPITVLTAPDDGLSQYSQATAATTNSAGAWTARIAAGPSRLVAVVYGGSATIQPSQSWAKLIVPARIRVLRVWPRHVAWGGQVHIKARLLGGYLPQGGALVRLRLGYGKAKITYGVQEHVDGNGIFEVTNRFGPGPPSLLLHYWLQECTLPQGDYPFSAACGPRDPVTVGGT